LKPHFQLPAAWAADGVALQQRKALDYNMQQATINWETLPQSLVRSELRAALNAGNIELLGITESEFRSLINGEAVNGVQLKAADLRAVGKAGFCDIRAGGFPAAAPAAAPAATDAPAAPAATDAGALEALRQILQPATPALDVNAVVGSSV